MNKDLDLEKKRPLDIEISCDTKRKKLEYTGILPIGKSSIEAVIRSGYYVDKTDHAETLFKEEATVFLSRPRRLGKSLFVSTLEEIAKGNKELFQDCYIYNKTNYDWKKYPVIRLDFSRLVNETPENLKESIQRSLQRTAIKYGIESKILAYRKALKKISSKEENDFFQEYCIDLVDNLITLEGYEPKVVVLVDEYDAPFINQSYPGVKESNRLIVRNFLTVIKSLSGDNKIKLEFVTGVSSYCFRDTYSGPNNLNDITLSPDYTTVAGYKEEDLLNKDSVYYKRINRLAEKRNISSDVLVGEIRAMYNPTFRTKKCKSYNYFIIDY
ncbi:AAA family ATPase [Cardinium endosymbiont of Culicoides punctatus]|uniref:AAA family ATPase n=1 Tax=Cardinium endosymbiont of Culicoides punctatus TaxID=2304601 RepID=UPI0014045D90|nr:AAA family ATPase [Cardinium endosymbiont of Culicoides punctatus]